MKAKIFSKLKQAYAELGLAEEILQGRAESLAKTGLVTDENIDFVVSVQKQELSDLQKLNDRRVQTALDKQKAKFEEDARKKAEEAEKIAREAKEKAEAENAAKEAQKAKEAEEDKKKAQEEAADKDRAAKEADELEALRQKGLSDDVLKFLEAQKAKAEQDRKSFEERLAKMLKDNEEKSIKQMEVITGLQEANKTLKSGYDDIVKENEAAKAAQALAERNGFIVSKAKELGIPDWRIKEGFVIGADADENAITEILSASAANLKMELLPNERPSYNMGISAPEDTKAMIDSIVKRQVK